MQAARLQRSTWLISIHLLFWLLVAGISYLVYYRLLGEGRVALVATVINLLGFLMLVYGHLYGLLPRFFDPTWEDAGRRFDVWSYRNYLFATLALLGATTTLRFFAGKWITQLYQWPVTEEFTANVFVSLLFGGTFFLFLSIPLRLINNWYKKQELEQVLKTQKLEAELRFLKAQVNPHFLFNALNNIYSLSFNESKQAPEMILRLSDMMSYMLYEGRSDQVSLKSEINYLQNYISLQQLKKEGEMRISFLVDPSLPNVQVYPLLFIPFFENAFKHGNLENTDSGWLQASIKYEDHQLKLQVRNSCREQQSDRPSTEGGVGLTNIHQRLALLYPNRYSLQMSREDDVFSVQLKISLSV